MNKEKKPVQLLKELDSLLTAKRYLLNTEKINGAIAETAEEFVAIINADLDDELQENSAPSATPKSEMPCNCRQDSREKLALMEMRNAFMKGKKYLLIPLDN